MCLRCCNCKGGSFYDFIKQFLQNPANYEGAGASVVTVLRDDHSDSRSSLNTPIHGVSRCRIFLCLNVKPALRPSWKCKETENGPIAMLV